jgi:hypothetical protein
VSKECARVQGWDFSPNLLVNFEVNRTTSDSDVIPGVFRKVCRSLLKTCGKIKHCY